MKEKFVNKLSKNIKDYFIYQQNQLKKQYNKDNLFFQMKDEEKKNFFNQVRKLWQEKHKNASVYDIEDTKKLEEAYKKYLSVIKKRLLKNYPDKSKTEIDKYLTNKIIDLIKNG